MRATMLRWIAVLSVIGCVAGEIQWVNNMAGELFLETPGNDYEEFYDSSKSIYTLLAVDKDTGSSAGIVYGFSKNKDSETDSTLKETSDYFRIDPVTGEVFREGNKLDYEAVGQRNLVIYLIAKKSDLEFSKIKTSFGLLDFNDNRPKFSNDSLSVTITENTIQDNGILLLKNIEMTDADSVLSSGRTYIFAEIQYCVIKGKPDIKCKDDFKLIPVKVSPKQYIGDFYLNNSLDYEKDDFFQVQIAVYDGYFTTVSDVNVRVQDQQDLPPEWVDLPPVVRIDEGYVIGIPVGQFKILVKAEDQDTQDKRDIFYTIENDPRDLPGETTSADVFEVDPLTGVIRNKVEIDLENRIFRPDTNIVRDTWPILLRACEIIPTDPDFIIGDDDETCSVIGTVEVQITDLNDNAPLPDKQLYIYEIKEDVPNGYVLDKPRIIITDADTELYNEHYSEFQVFSPEFKLIGATANPAIAVRNATLIDYEVLPNEYKLTLITYDAANETLFSVADIIIRILDANDNRPQYSQPSYVKYIPEDSNGGTKVIKIEATDIDSGIFGTNGIKYQILRSNYSRLFTIEDNGQVYVANCDTYGVFPCLDYDHSPESYPLSIQAIDTNGEGKASTVTLTVYLIDVNDNPPTVDRSYYREIVENNIFFTPNFTIPAVDVDAIDKGKLVFSIQSQSPNQFWAIDSRTGTIYVNKPRNEVIKFEDGDNLGRFQLVVAITDTNGKHTVFTDVTIRVIDQNDKPPQFFPSEYEISINELIPGGESILQLTATDKDDPTSENGRLAYRIESGNVGGKFRLDSVSGILYTNNNATFDYDIRRRYVMQGVVNDNGTVQLSATAAIIVNILDNNNKNPEIIPFLKEYNVSENAPIGLFVGKVNARDPDLDAVLRFAFTDSKEASSVDGYVVDPINGYDFRNLFIIEPGTGDIRVNQPLDSRETAIVSYGVQVTDIKANPPQVGPGRIVINIKPFNTKAPKIEAFDTPIYIDEEQPIGSVIISLVAEDDNGIDKFRIKEQPKEKFFDITEKTGSVSIQKRIDYDSDRRINDSYFIVEVTDLGEPILSATASVSVIFRNINDFFPDFMDPDRGTKKSIYTARIPENSPNGTNVVEVYAFDNDRPDNNTYDQVRYYMDDDRFDVDPMTGQIFVSLRNGAVLDRETNARLNARVIAIDNPKGPDWNRNQRAASLQVTLTDVNDNCPVFSDDEYEVTVFASIGEETDILQLFTADRDVSDFAISLYKKKESDTASTDYLDLFDVREEFGRIYVKKNLKAQTGTYRFTVLATDNVGKGCTTEVPVVVRVLPAGSVPPYWVIPAIDNMTIYVLEEQYNGMLVYDISARDDDTGLNGMVDYSFIYEGVTTQATPDFKINSVTGVIQAERVYDRETVDKYVLLLKATDRGTTPLETTRFLTVVVLDVNDNDPAFNEREFQVFVTEDQPLGDIRQIPSAVDRDLNPVIVYDIISGNEDGVFELDPNTRMLRLLKPLDRESKGIYYMDVLASNDDVDYTVIRSRRRRAVDQSILTVKVVVGDINDLAPAFLQDEYYGCVSARAPYDKHILTTKAIDRDAIGTGVVRFTVTDGNKVANRTLFDVHPKFGVVTNKVLMRQYAGNTFYVTINARDREDVETAESASTVAKIFVNQPGNEVRLLITQHTGEVRLYQSQIQSIIEEAPDLDYVCINEIQDHVVDSVGSVSTLWSDVYITGIRKETVDNTDRYFILSNTELKNIVNRERYNRKSDFDLLYIKEVEAASSNQEIELEDQAVLIILIIIAILIFLVIIFCIVAFLCIRAAKKQKKAMLLHRTHATPAPMMVEQPVIVEPVIYDNRGYVAEEQHVVETVENDDPVHVHYAVVKKGPTTPQYVEQEVYYEEDPDAIVVELKNDEPEQHDVYEAGPEYVIETEVVTDQEGM